MNNLYYPQDEEAMEFSALAKAFSASSEVCRCILKSDFLKVRRCTLISIAIKSLNTIKILRSQVHIR